MTARVQDDDPCNKKKSHHMQSTMTLVYAVFAAGAWFLFHFVWERNIDGLMNISAMMQCLGILLLVVQVCSNESVAGISARGLMVSGMSLVCRLSNTSWLNGYLPHDASGDYLYQLTDLIALLLISWLLYQVFYVKMATYDKDSDTFPVSAVVIWSLVLGMLFHADLNQRPLFDSLWMAHVFISRFATMPQLHMFARTGGSNQAMTCHYVAAYFVSSICDSFVFVNTGSSAVITCREWIPGVNHAQLACTAAVVFGCLSMFDFAYFYVTSIMRDGLNNMELKLDICV